MIHRLISCINGITFVEIAADEHVIKCNMCGRGLIVKDNVNNGVAFLSHLKNDHQIFFIPQRSVMQVQKERQDDVNGQMLEPPK